MSNKLKEILKKDPDKITLEDVASINGLVLTNVPLSITPSGLPSYLDKKPGSIHYGIPQYTSYPPETGIEMILIIPKKLKYQHSIAQLLEEGFDSEKVKTKVQKNMDEGALKNKKGSDLFTQNDIISYSNVYYGYSITDVDGGFYSPVDKLEEERSYMIKFVFLPDLEKYYQNDLDLEQKIKKISMEVLNSYLQRQAPPHSVDDFESKIIKELNEWFKKVQIFIYGYIIAGVCSYIQDLCESGSLKTEKAEKEIWLTFALINVNRIIFPVKKNPSGRRIEYHEPPENLPVVGS